MHSSNVVSSHHRLRNRRQLAAGIRLMLIVPMIVTALFMCDAHFWVAQQLTTVGNQAYEISISATNQERTGSVTDNEGPVSGPNQGALGFVTAVMVTIGIISVQAGYRLAKKGYRR